MLLPKRPFVKVCCISSIEEADVAISLGASALGLVSEMPSGPGVIDEEAIAEIARNVPPSISTFLLTALQDADEIVEQHDRCGTSTLQLVDRMELQELRKLRIRLPNVKLVQVIHVQDKESVEEALSVAPLVDALLLDSGNQQLVVKELGGTGRTHDWTISRRIRDQVRKPVFLAGGLNSSNVRQAIEAVEPFGLDLCSSVRTNDTLDPTKLWNFLSSIQDRGC